MLKTIHVNSFEIIINGVSALPWFQKFIFIIFIAKGKRENKPLVESGN